MAAQPDFTGQHGDGLRQLATEAYAAGWALSGGPMTVRVKAGCHAAVGLALENASDPHILEVAFDLGAVEGTWATYFDRREQLQRKHEKQIAAALAVILAELAADKVAARLLAETGGTVYAAEYLTAIATQAAGGLLAGVLAHAGHAGLQASVEDALRAAKAEGQAGALVINAEEHGTALSFDAAFEHAYAALAHDPDLPFLARSVLQDFTAGSSRELGKQLADLLAGKNATREQVLALIEQALDVTRPGSVTNRALSYYLSRAIAAAMAQAALDLFASEGMEDTFFLTAGLSNVCPLCESYEAGNPYLPQTCPVPGRDTHGGCRCIVSTRAPRQFAALDRLAA